MEQRCRSLFNHNIKTPVIGKFKVERTKRGLNVEIKIFPAAVKSLCAKPKEPTMFERFMNPGVISTSIFGTKKTSLKQMVVDMRKDMDYAQRKISYLQERSFATSREITVPDLEVSVLKEKVSRMDRSMESQRSRINTLEDEVKRLRKFFDLKESVVEGKTILVDKYLNVKKWVKNAHHS